MPPRKARTGVSRKAKEPSLDVYEDMLAEGAVADPIESRSRPLKRRRIMREVSIPEYQHDGTPKPKSKQGQLSTPKRARSTQPEPSAVRANPEHERMQQTVEASSDSDDSDDFTFEDVDLRQQDTPKKSQDDDIGDVSISVDQSASAKKQAANRRKPATTVEKSFRILVHKAHFLTLLAHCTYVNSRCSNEAVQKHMRKLLDKRMLSYLNPKKNDSQFQRNRSFIEGLEQASKVFKAEFRVTASGLRRARWPVEGETSSASPETEPMDLADFVTAARELEGSQDTGNQLFCAMLREAGVNARLVCSLQTLPFANAPAKTSTPQKYKKPTVFAIASDTDPNASDASLSDNSIGASSTIGKVPSIRRRLGQPSFAPEPAAKAPPRERKKPIRKLSYPVFWVEAFNEAHQKWVTVDPMMTDTINKPSKIEPPASYDLNQLTYAIAFESNFVARDVTRRYAKAFNAKTRRQRVEGTGEEGTKWLKKAMKLLRRRGAQLDRDQVEDAELAQKEAREGLPSNVLDFKGHPYYALERHLRRNEVLHPRREVGKVNAGTAAKPRMEAVFRRQDVMSCKSADKWYRLGREIKAGEQPLKHVPARAPRRDEEDDGAPKSTPFYAPYQTELYVPPPVVGGRIPRNNFGNLDIYVPSMVPPGATHIHHALTQQAARIVGVDYAEAVTGFKFQGRHGTAIIEGAVVAQEYAEAVQATIDGLEHAAMEEESRARSLTALRLWARFLKGLQISARVAAYGDKVNAEAVKDAIDREQEEEQEAVEAGGFVPDEGDAVTMPTAGRFSVAELTMSRSEKKRGKRKVVETEESEGEYWPTTRRGGGRGGRVLPDDEDEYMPDVEGDGGGGFVAEDAEETVDQSGGFVVEDAMAEDSGGGGFVTEESDLDTAAEEGGFLPQDVETAEESPQLSANDEGGGFLVEDGAEEPVPNNARTRETRDSPDDIAMSGGGGFVEEAEDQAPLLEPGASFMAAEEPAQQHDHTTDPGTAPDGCKQPPTDRDPGATDVGTSLPIRGSPGAEHLDTGGPGHMTPTPAPTEQTVDPEEGYAQMEDDEADRGSLLSHDPEDDDAEPDWLESD